MEPNDRTVHRPGEPAPGGVSDLLRGIADDVKAIFKDEAALAREELGRTAKVVGADAAAIVLAGIVALIGFGFLCTAAVVALEPLIDSLAIRLVLMAVVYLALGGGVAAYFAKKLQRDVAPTLRRTAHEAKHTITVLKEELRNV